MGPSGRRRSGSRRFRHQSPRTPGRIWHGPLLPRSLRGRGGNQHRIGAGECQGGCAPGGEAAAASCVCDAWGFLDSCQGCARWSSVRTFRLLPPLPPQDKVRAPRLLVVSRRERRRGARRQRQKAEFPDRRSAAVAPAARRRSLLRLAARLAAVTVAQAPQAARSLRAREAEARMEGFETLGRRRPVCRGRSPRGGPQVL